MGNHEIEEKEKKQRKTVLKMVNPTNSFVIVAKAIIGISTFVISLYMFDLLLPDPVAAFMAIPAFCGVWLVKTCDYVGVNE